MSDSISLEYSPSIVDKLLSLDNEMKARVVDGKNENVNEIYQSYFDRLTLYEKSTLVPMSESDKLLLQDKKEDLYIELKLFKLKQELKRQLEETQTVLDDLGKSP